MKFLIVLGTLVAAVAGDVSHLPSSDYLPPTQQEAASARDSYQMEADSAPVVEFYHVESASAPAASYQTASYEDAASEPASSYTSADGYRYKTVKRRIIRRQRRDVSHLSSEYLPPQADLESIVQTQFVPTYSQVAAEPEADYETVSYESDPSEPAHSYSSDEGYRYKTAKRRIVLRRRRL